VSAEAERGQLGLLLGPEDGENREIAKIRVGVFASRTLAGRDAVAGLMSFTFRSIESSGEVVEAFVDDEVEMSEPPQAESSKVTSETSTSLFIE
jgi:hypothetical protein